MSEKLKHIIYTQGDCISEKTMFDYIDHKLSALEQHKVEKHLIDCDLCTDALDGLRLVKNRNKISEINTTINKQLALPEKKRVVFDIRTVMTAAAGLLLLIGGVFFFRQFITNSKENIAELKTTISKESQSRENITTITEKTLTSSEAIKADEDDFKKADKDKPEQQSTEPDSKLLEDQNEKGSGYFNAKIADETSVSEEENLSPAEDFNNNITSVNSSNQGAPVANAPATDKILSKESDERLDDSKSTSSAGKAENKDGILAFESRSSKMDDKTKSKNEKKKEERKEAEQKPSSATINTFDQPVQDLKQNTDLEIQMDSTITFSGNTEKIFSKVDQMPQFPGGETALQKYFADNINSAVNNDAGSIATVNIQFVVNSKGKAINGKLIKPTDKELETQIIEAINKMPLWTPGKSNGEAVNILYELPLKINSR